jgi:type I restriction enzyme S subunit
MGKYKLYKESGVDWIGVIPGNWSLAKLKYNADISFSSVDRHQYEIEKPVSICHYPDAYKNEIIDETTSLSKGSCTQTEFDKFQLKKEQVIITKDSESANDIGVPTYVLKTLENTVCGYHLALIESHKNILTGKYIFRYLQTNIVKTYFELNSNGVTRFGLGKPTIMNLPIPIIPLSEQTQITNYIDYKTQIIDTLIEKKEQLIKKLQAQRQAIINEAVTKGLNKNAKLKDSGIEWLGEIPEHWKVVKLKYTSDVSFSSVDRHQYEDELKVNICHYPDAYKNDKILTKTKLSKGTCTVSEFEKYQLKKGQVIITKDSESADDIGVPTFVTQTFEKAVCGYHLAILSTDITKLNGEYLFRFLQTDKVKSFFETNANGVTRFGIGKPTIENLYVPVLNLKEQNEIVHQINIKADKIDTTIIQVKSVIQKLKYYRQSVISEAVTGKIDVRDWQVTKG